MNSSFKRLICSAVSAAVLLCMTSAAALEKKEEQTEQSPVSVTFPTLESDKTIVGNDGITVVGTAAGETSLAVTVNGKSAGSAEVLPDGSFSAKITSFAIDAGLNDIELSPKSGKASTSLRVKKQYYYDVADFPHEISGAAESYWQTGVSKFCPELSVGGQTIKTLNGFSLRPEDGRDADKASADIDISGVKKQVRYFRSTIGVDDFANVGGTVGSSVVFSVLADGKTVAVSREMDINEVDEIFAEIPAVTKKLTLRVSSVDGSNRGDYGDFINPRIFLRSEDFSGTETELGSFSEQSTLTAKAQTAARLNLKGDFSSVTVKPEKAGDRVFGRLFKFTYSFARSMQNGALCEAELSPDGQGNYTFALNGLYGPGEYLFVFDGVTEIKTAQSDKGYIFSDGKAKTGLLNMTVNFSGKISAPLDPVTAEPAATSEKSVATKDEINRARETYQSYITNLEKFPSKMKIGNKEYVGFSDRDFSKLSQKAGTDEVAKSETAEIVLLHKSGLQFTLKTAFYPDYAAFDWVLYFENITSSNSPIVTDISSAELKFEGENPVILTSCGDTEADTQATAPFIPRSYSLEDTNSVSFCPSNGRSTEVGFPYYNFEYGNGGALIATSWAGQWQTDFEYSDGVTSFSGRQQTFNSYLKAGEIARTPLTAVILYDGRNTDRATNLWRRWMIDCNMYKKDGKTNLKPFIAGLPGEVMRETEQNMVRRINYYNEQNVDIDYFWIDAGWYIDGNTKTWIHVGNWTMDTDRFPNKLLSVSEACKNAGMKGGVILWFEPERNAFSLKDNEFDLYGAKKEWIVGYNGAKNTAVGPDDYHIFDLGNNEALFWMTDKIKTVLTEGNISIYREDFNNGWTRRIWNQINAAEPDRAGMIENGGVQGHLRLWDNILSLDNIEMIDSCASGGHRLELETMRRAVALHPTDYNYNDLTARHRASYGLACWFPFTGANTGFDNYHTFTDKYIMRSSFRQSIACQVNIEGFSEQRKQLLRDCISEWKSINGYFYDDIYELTDSNVSGNEWYAYSYINPDEQDGFALVFNHGGKFSPSSKNIRLKGLNPDDTYELTFADFDGTVTASGAELMSVGVEMTLDENEHNGGGDSDIIYIRRTSSAVKFGDTDGDGEITVTDALLALQGSVNKITLDNDAQKRADVDGDEKITVTDALLILQKAVNKIDVFPAE